MKLKKKVLIVILIFIVLMLKNNAYAIEDEKTEYSKAYQQYLELSEEEKKKLGVIPPKYDIPMDVLYEDQKQEKTNIFSRIFNFVRSIQTEQLPQSYILLKDESTDVEVERYGGIDIKVENQGSEGLCWAFASLTALETNLALQGHYYDFSERHADYLTSTEFGGTRLLGDGGWFNEHFMKYASNNYGPVLEEEVPYNKVYNEMEYDYLFSLKPAVYVKDSTDFPTIYGDETTNYDENDITLFRNKIKEHLMKNGGVFATICSSESMGTTITWHNGKYVLNYQGEDILDHAITIIGWDDNFSIENFPEYCRPTNNGAYIALNSWGEALGDEGIFYISYEDKWVNAYMSGITEADINYNSFDPLKFDDENLYNEVKDILGKRIINCDDDKKEIITSKAAIESIEKIVINNKNISSIKGLENFINLETLDISNNNISNIEGIENLTNLRKLYISNNDITNLEPIQSLNSLFILDISNNNITNIESLQKVTSIDELYMSNNNITDISCLPNVFYNILDVSGNKIEILPNQAINGAEFYFDNCNINDERVLELYEKIPDYLILSLKDNNITDLGCLKYQYYERRTLDVSGNMNLDLTKMPNVGELILSNCNISDVSPIAEYFPGRTLKLSNNQIQDITPLKDMDLYSLDISYTNVVDVSSLTNIKKINVSGNKNISGLNSLINLIELKLDDCELDNNKLKELIAGLNDLTTLSINNNNIRDLECLNTYYNLKTLYANYNSISNINTLTNTNIYNLYLNHNNISDISNLSNFRGFEHLELSNNNIIDASPLELIKVEYSIELSNNKISEISENLSREVLKSQTFSLEINLEKDKESVIQLPTIINYAFKRGMYDENVKFICENCTIDARATKVKIKPNILGNGQAKVTIKGGSFDGTTYTVNYDAVENITITDIKVKSEQLKKYYIENEKFDSTGIIVEVIYENGLVEEITDYTIANGDPLVAGQETVKIVSNKNPEIECTANVKVYGLEEIKTIQFPDENLYNAIKSKIVFGDAARDIVILNYNDDQNIIVMPNEYIEKITFIELGQKSISNIRGLEEFVNLERIDLRYNMNLQSIEDIANLKKLQTIELYDTNVVDISSILNNESIINIALRKRDTEVITSAIDKIELPKFIYQSLTMQEGVTAEAYIFYDSAKQNYKSVNVDIDTENEVATIQLDRKVTNENKNGIREVEVEIKGGKTPRAFYSTSYEVNVELEKIEVSVEAGKLSYREGQNFDPSWMKVIATYNNGETKEITDYEIVDGDNLTQDKTEVTISYTENGITKTTTQPISVYTVDKLVNIHFPDTHLYNAIKDTTAVQNNLREVRRNLVVDYNDETNTVQMVKERLEQVDSLYLMQMDIRDISGVENFVNLERIDLSFNINLESIDKLLLLEKISSIDIHITKIENVSEFIKKESVKNIILRKDDQNVINSTTTEIELPDFIYQSLTMQEGVTAEAYIYYDTYHAEDEDYYSNIGGEKGKTEVVIDTERQKAKVKLDREITNSHDEGVRGVEVQINGGKTNRARYIGFYNNIEKINVVEAPTKTRYVVGQSFNPAGMKLTATYRDNSVSEIKDYTVVDGENLKEGQNNVTISYTENGLTKTTTQGIIVRNEEDEKVLKDDSKYYTDESKILGISPDTIISEFINNFNMKYRIVITKNDNEVTEGIIGTGMEIKILENDEEKAKYTAIVVGDTNGDGNANVKDMVKINNYRLYGTTTNFEEIYQNAADINKDGNIDVKDMIRINNYRLYNTSLVD